MAIGLIGRWRERREFEFMLGELAEAIDRSGAATVRWESLDQELYEWLRSQRLLWRRGKLPIDRAARIEQVAGQYTLTYRPGWRAGYKALQSFVGREGTGRVPQLWVEDGFPLGYWLSIQRWQAASGRMSHWQRRQLSELCGRSWRRSVRNTQRIGAVKPRELVPMSKERLAACGQKFAPGSPALATVELAESPALLEPVLAPAQAKPAAKKPRRSKTPKRPAADLPGDKWGANYQLLQQYVDEHGDARVPVRYEIGGVRLGQWVARQRQQYKKGKLSIERQELLEALPGWKWRAK